MHANLTGDTTLAPRRNNASRLALKAQLTVYNYNPTVHLPFHLNNLAPSPSFSLTNVDEHIDQFIHNSIAVNYKVFSTVTCDSLMADYGALKVQDLKKLLQERNLATTGNKPDLIKRLQDADREAEAGSSAAAAPGMSLYLLQLLHHQAFLGRGPVFPPSIVKSIETPSD